MKVATTSFSLLPSILSNKKARLIVITGKGGVGKTSLSLACVKFLSSRGRKVLYNSFDQPANTNLISQTNTDHFDLDVESSAQEYIGKKIGSTTVASWIMKTPFFKSLFNMLPGLAQMILLGNIINMLESDEDLTIVLDSPSSGHALTMLESPENFKEMFRTGLIVEDIDRMQNFLFRDEKMLLMTASLPSQMATVEALELGIELKKRGVPKVHKILNDSLTVCSEILNSPRSEYPEFLKTKLSLEEDLIKNLEKDQWPLMPHFSLNSQDLVIEAMTNFLSTHSRDSA